LENHGQRVSRGVKQAGFLVLRNTVMPSILIEAGFLNHSKEETFLVSEDGKSSIAQSIFNAFTKYKYEQDHMLAANEDIEAIPANNQITTSETVATAEVKIKEEVIKEEPINYVERAKRQIEKMKKSHEKQTPRPMTASIKEDHKVAAAEPAVPKTQSIEMHTAVPMQTSNEEAVTPTVQPAEDGKIVPRQKKLEYAVQLSASTSKFLSGGGKWDKVQDVMIRREGNLYKYQVGMLKTYEDAASKKDQLRRLGFKDCFVVAYYNDDQIGLKDAQRLNL